MMHAHGGLVGETQRLELRARHRTDGGSIRSVYPVYFIWETSAFEIIKQRLGLSRGIWRLVGPALRTVRPTGRQAALGRHEGVCAALVEPSTRATATRVVPGNLPRRWRP